MDWHVGSLLGGDAVTRALTCLATTLRGICPLIAFASVAASLGCRFGGSDLYAGDRMDTDGGLAGDAGGDGANGDGNASSIPDLNGSWAQRWTVASVDSLPVIGDVSASTTSIHRLSIEQHGLELLVRVIEDRASRQDLAAGCSAVPRERGRGSEQLCVVGGHSALLGHDDRVAPGLKHRQGDEQLEQRWR